jgi:hypothetical protein
MSAGPEARHENDDKNEHEAGISARLLGPTSAEQRIEVPPLTAGKGEGGGALPAPSGIICLCVIAGRHQCSTDPVQLTRALGLNPASPVTDAQILLAAKWVCREGLRFGAYAAFLIPGRAPFFRWVRNTTSCPACDPRYRAR